MLQQCALVQYIMSSHWETVRHLKYFLWFRLYLPGPWHVLPSASVWFELCQNAET
uniref:Uncharacterized protein n=1 Tax=Anguilla anguilla TaxID=7936 RepID=A0A0E9WUC0_ANGAN